MKKFILALTALLTISSVSFANDEVLKNEITAILTQNFQKGQKIKVAFEKNNEVEYGYIVGDESGLLLTTPVLAVQGREIIENGSNIISWVRIDNSTYDIKKSVERSET